VAVTPEPRLTRPAIRAAGGNQKTNAQENAMSVKTVRRSLAALLVAAASLGAIAQAQAANLR